jgi:pimeloyl-ACP methyl ester carboxylesterase
MMTRTVLLVHGAWLNAYSWEGFKKRYEAAGMTVVAPSWPYDDRSPAELRANPAKELKNLSQRQTLDHYEGIIRKLPEPPMIIGHSLGGAYTQHLLDRGLGVSGVAIDPAPTPGVPLGPQAIISALPVLGDPFSGGKVMHMSRKFFRTRFAQLVPPGESDQQYDRYIVPTPGKVYWNGVIGAIPINWKNPDRAPLLLIAGGKDLIADASMTKAIYEKQKRAPSLTEFKLYPDRSHWTCLDRGWEEVADYALEWSRRNARAAR